MIQRQMVNFSVSNAPFSIVLTDSRAVIDVRFYRGDGLVAAGTWAVCCCADGGFFVLVAFWNIDFLTL